VCQSIPLHIKFSPRHLVDFGFYAYLRGLNFKNNKKLVGSLFQDVKSLGLKWFRENILTSRKTSVTLKQTIAQTIFLPFV